MSWLGVTLILVLVSILEMSLGGPWMGGHLAVDFTTVVVVYAALLYGPRHGAVAGFVGGLLADLAVPSVFGRSALVMTLIGYAVGLVGERTARENVFTQAVLLACAVFAREIYVIMLAGPESTVRGMRALAFYGLPAALLTAVAGIALFGIYTRFTGQRVR